MSPDMLLACLAIGLAAALGAMTLPFRRGIVGVVVNLVVGAGGAVALAALSAPLSHRAAAPLLGAAVGAVVMLVGAHLLWHRIAMRTRTPPRPGASG